MYLIPWQLALVLDRTVRLPCKNGKRSRLPGSTKFTIFGEDEQPKSTMEYNEELGCWVGVDLASGKDFTAEVEIDLSRNP